MEEISKNNVIFMTAEDMWKSNIKFDKRSSTEKGVVGYINKIPVYLIPSK